MTAIRDPEAARIPRAHECNDVEGIARLRGTSAYDARVEIVDAACRTIDVEFYTIAPGDAAERLGEALLRAGRRGVRVRVLIDAFGSSSLPAQWIERLSATGIDIRRFNPRPLLRWSIRDHRKLVVCDGQCRCRWRRP